jgi:hypothetical protein
MPTRTFAGAVKDGWDKSRKPLAYLLVMVAIVSRFIPGHDFGFAGLAAAFLILLLFVFEIHKAVTLKEPPKYYASFAAAIPRILQELDRFMQGHGEHRSIRVLGIVLFHQWPLLDPYLGELLAGPNPRRVNVEIALVDPTWPDLPALNPASQGMATGCIGLMEAFADLHHPRMAACGWSFSVHTYRYTPHLFGMLIGDDVLFVGRSFWAGDLLRGGQNEIEEFDTRDAHGRQKIDEFKGWFGKCKQVRVI